MANKSAFKCSLIMLVHLLLMLYDSTMGKIIYVDNIATGANNGSSWADAYIYLRDALADANSDGKLV
jgi:hypothetical protein